MVMLENIRQRMKFFYNNSRNRIRKNHIVFDQKLKDSIKKMVYSKFKLKIEGTWFRPKSKTLSKYGMVKLNKIILGRSLYKNIFHTILN